MNVLTFVGEFVNERWCDSTGTYDDAKVEYLHLMRYFMM